jgi:fructokinase
MFDVLALGETVIDLTPVGFSERGNTIYESQPGGAPSNMLAAASRLGAKTALIGVVGDDPFGEFLRGVLRSCDIDSSGVVTTAKAPTVMMILKIDGCGNRSFFKIQTKTAIDVFDEEELDFSMIDNCRVFYVAGSLFYSEGTLAVVKKSVTRAKSAGKIICCDVNWRSQTSDEAYMKKVILPMVSDFDILKISEEELYLLCGPTELETGARMLYDRGVKLVVVTLGPGGCYYHFAGGCGRLYTYDVKVVDTNGCGDIFTGAMLVKMSGMYEAVEWISDENMREIMDFANAAGSLGASKRGAILAAPTMEEIERCRVETPLLRQVL